MKRSEYKYSDRRKMAKRPGRAEFQDTQIEIDLSSLKIRVNADGKDGGGEKSGGSEAISFCSPVKLREPPLPPTATKPRLLEIKRVDKLP